VTPPLLPRKVFDHASLGTLRGTARISLFFFALRRDPRFPTVASQPFDAPPLDQYAVLSKSII